MSIIRGKLEKNVGRKWTKRLAFILTTLFVYILVASFAHIWPFSSAIGVAERVTDPRAVIGNYEWFYNQYHAIEAQRRNVAIMEEGSTDRIGTQMVLYRMIAEYNARSKEITRNLWKADDLPYQIYE